jgi:hypothetical protein
MLKATQRLLARALSMAAADAPLVAVQVSAGGQVCPHWWPTKVPAPGLIVCVFLLSRG